MPKAPKPRSSPPPSKTLIRKFATEIRKMVKDISRMYENQVLGGLNKGTINKFHDAQTGNYAVITATLNNRFKAKMKRRFNNKRIKNLVSGILGGVKEQNADGLYSGVESVTGISTQQMFRQEGLTPEFNAMMVETEEWVKRLRDEHLVAINNNTLRMMKEGRSISDIVKEVRLNTGKAVTSANLVATQQVTSFNGLSSKLRYQKLGVVMATWQTSKNEKVRPSHRDREGKVFELAVGLYSSVDGKVLFPGTDYTCQCTLVPVLE